MYSIKLDSSSAAILRRLFNLPNPVRKSIHEGFELWGYELVRTAENAALNEPKYGNWYPSEIKKLHRASAAGQTPAYRTGNWNKKLFYKSSPFQLEFGNSAKYAEFLEEGTPKMEARTGLLNAIESTQRNFRTYQKHSLDKHLKL
jgi:hypothetical protein